MVLRLNLRNMLIIIFLCIILFFSSFIHSKTVKTVSDSIQNEGVFLPIIMYHHITENGDKAGKYTITREQFRKDLIFLKEKGYTTVSCEMLISYVNGEADLPQKPVMLTFDDGFESFYALAYPILTELKMHCTVSVIGSLADEYTKLNDHNINYSYLTWQEIKELEASPYVEVQSHTYDLHQLKKGNRKGMKKRADETAEDYEKIINNDLNKMQKLLKENASTNATAIAYPYGLYSEETLDIVKKTGFKISFTCEEHVNFIKKGDKSCLYNLGRYNRPSGESSEEYFKIALTEKQTAF